MSPREPVDHVARPDLPWRTSTTSECGRDLTDVHAYITRDQLLARLKDWGQQRTSLHTCMTCWTTASKYEVFEKNPIQAMAREVGYGARNDQVSVELRALAALAVKYRDEFDDYVAGVQASVSLDAARLARRRQAYYGTGPTKGA